MAPTEANRPRIGIDVGGTFTDGVLVEGSSVLEKAKAETTDDVTAGIIATVDTLLERSGVDPPSVEMVSFATTHTTNAIIEREGLDRTGIFRLALPTGTTIPPLTGWPDDLRTALGGDENVVMVEGGYELDGTPISDLSEAEISDAAADLNGSVDSIAITGVFSPVRDAQERRAAELIQAELGEDIPITRSSEIASISLLERENSAVLNAAVISVMRRAISALEAALADRGIDQADMFVVQNDGSVMRASYAAEYPIFTVASGPAASIRGAVFLSGIDDGVVIDVGGTSSDIGYMVDGFPRESTMLVEIGGVKTNIRAPDLTSIALGGGTVIKERDGTFTALGPESVGFNLRQLARSYDGPITTVHDIAVARGHLETDLEIFDTPFATNLEVTNEFPDSLVSTSWDAIRGRLEQTIDEMKTTPEDVPAVLVGGGSTVVPEGYAGTSATYHPTHFEVAGAVGATLAEIAAYAENVIDMEQTDRTAGIEETTEMAKQNAVRNGAVYETIEVIDIEEIPFTYMPGEREKIRVRVKGAYGGV